MRKSAAVILFVVGVSACVACFFAGKRYGAEIADSGSRRRVLLKEGMVVLDSRGDPRGTIAAGTRLYSVADPYGDRTSLFKLFLQTDANDEAARDG